MTTASGQRWGLRTKGGRPPRPAGRASRHLPRGGQDAHRGAGGVADSSVARPGRHRREGRHGQRVRDAERGVPSPWEVVVGDQYAYMLKLRSDSGTTAQVLWGRIPARPGLFATAQVDLAAGEVLDLGGRPEGPELREAGGRLQGVRRESALPVRDRLELALGEHGGRLFGGASDITFAGLRVSACRSTRRPTCWPASTASRWTTADISARSRAPWAICPSRIAPPRSATRG